MLNNQILRYWQAKNNDIDQLLLNASIHYLPILFSTIQYEMGCVDKPTGKGTVKTCSFWDMLRTCFIPSYQLLHVFFFPLSTYSHGRPCAYTHTHLHFTHRFIWRVPTMGVTSRPKQTKGPKKNKSSMSIGFSIINHPATGVPPFFENPPCICVFHHGTSIWSLTKFRSLGSTLPRPQWRARTRRRWFRHIGQLRFRETLCHSKMGKHHWLKMNQSIAIVVGISCLIFIGLRFSLW